MEKIVLEVNSETAKKWKDADSRTRKKIVRYIEDAFQKKDDMSREEFWKYLENLRTETEKRGLTKDILNDILNE
jgi:hypothetical protein